MRKPDLPSAPNPDHVATMTTRNEVQRYLAQLDVVKEGHYAQMEWFYSAPVRYKRWKLRLKAAATIERVDQLRRARMGKRVTRIDTVERRILEHAKLTGKSEEETKHAIVIAVSCIKPRPAGIRERWFTYRGRVLKARLQTIESEPRFEPYPHIWAINQAELRLKRLPVSLDEKIEAMKSAHYAEVDDLNRELAYLAGSTAALSHEKSVVLDEATRKAMEEQARMAAEEQTKLALERAKRVRVEWVDPDGGKHYGRIDPGRKFQWEEEEKARWAAEKGEKARREANWEAMWK